MRTLTADTLRRLQNPRGENPILVVKLILPGGGAMWFSDRTVTIDSVRLDGRIMEAGTLETSVKVDGGSRIVGTVGVQSLTLSDNDLALKTLMDTTDLQGTYVSVYHWFGGQTQADLLLLLKGRIEAAPSWNEMDRTLSFEVETPRRLKPVPFAPTESDGLDVDEDLLGRVWPMCFGTPSDVPACAIKMPPSGNLVQDLTQNGKIQTIDGVVTQVESSTFEVDNPNDDFPQDQEVTVRVGNEYITGSFDGNTFTVTERQVDRYTGLNATADGETITLPAGKRAAGYYISVYNTGTLVFRGYCHKQVGRLCYIWAASPSWTGTLEARVNRYPFTPEEGARWVHKGGTPVVVTNQPVVYVANQLASTSIKRVRAWRQIAHDDQSGYTRRQIVTVDPAIYTVDLSNSDYNGATTITFEERLSDRDAGWDDEIFVTVESSVGSNTADALAHLIDNQTEGSLTAGASFDTVAEQIQNYPSNFAILDQDDVLNLVGSIAWQARCGVTWNGATAELHYLSLEPTTNVLALTNTSLAEGGIKLSTTAIEDVVTVFNAEWQPNYSDRKPKKIVYQTNIARYGKREQTYRFWIYQRRSLVAKSAAFWAMRRGRIWRLVDAAQWGLEALHVDPLDYVQWDISGFYSAVPALTLSAGMESWENTAVKAMLPIEAGATTQSSNFWTSDDDDEAPAEREYTAGDAEEEIIKAPPPEVMIPAQAEPTVFHVVAVSDEISNPLDADWKKVGVRIKSDAERALDSTINAKNGRIGEINFLDPDGTNGVLQNEKSTLLTDVNDATQEREQEQARGRLVTAQNPSVSYMLTGDEGTALKVGDDYIVSPVNASGPFIATVTKPPASPAEATLTADVAGSISNGPQGAVEVTGLADISAVKIGDKLLVFRDARGGYFTAGAGVAGTVGAAKVITSTDDKNAVPIGVYLTATDFTADPDLSVSAKMPALASGAIVPAGYFGFAVKLAGQWVFLPPVYTEFVE